MSNPALYEARDAKDFVSRLRERTGHGPLELLGSFVKPERIQAIVLGGSIPLGISTASSDIDLLVLVDSSDALVRVPLSDRVFFAGSFGNSGELAIGTAVLRQTGVELDLQFILLQPLIALLAAAKSSCLALSLQQRQIVSRLRTGWLLEPTTWPVPLEDLRDEAFDIYCAVQSLVAAYRALVDAKVALDDNHRLAMHMGRQSVEKAFEAYFASLGFSSLGLKWLRFLERRRATVTGDGRGIMPASLASRGQDLLFPSQTQGYLAQVENFIAEVRAVIERNIRYKVAFDLSPHIAKPRIADGRGAGA